MLKCFYQGVIFQFHAAPVLAVGSCTAAMVVTRASHQLPPAPCCSSQLGHRCFGCGVLLLAGAPRTTGLGFIRDLNFNSTICMKLCGGTHIHGPFA